VSPQVLTRIENGILRVTLARPEKKNALTADMYESLIAALDRAQNEAIGALMIEGSTGVFTAGNDIGDFLAHASDFHNAPALRFIRAIATCETPIVAAVEGAAVGVGVTMLLHCDLVYAAPSARFRMPFVDLGLVPEAAASLLLPHRVGRAKASEFLLLGDAFDAEAAARLGLVNAVIPGHELAATALRQAQRLAEKPRAALRATRRLLRGDAAAVLTRIEEEAVAFATALGSDEARAAMTAFMMRAKI
jgi:enoyl-CoA hydratase/carnithine racemase